LVPPIKLDEKVKQAGFKSFNSIARALSIHYQNMLNYFDHPITSASAKVSNTKKKFLEHNLEGVQTIIMFFLDSQIFSLNVKIS
tara:strand:+ start:394 stop:645 length:252 start_codon:yes stop_codon:yes gene_type:complete